MSKRRGFGFVGAFAVVCALWSVWPALASANIYWSGLFGGGVGSDTIDGNAANKLPAFIPVADTTVPAGVAVDGKFIYWANSASGGSGTPSIGRAGLDGSNINPTFITTDTSEPVALAVGGGFIYWADFKTGLIERDTIDGDPNNIVTVANPGPNQVTGLTVDNSHIYWTMGDTSGTTIESANLDGSNLNPTFITGQAGPVGVAVAGGFIYWTNIAGNTAGAGTIARDTVDGNPSNITTVVGSLNSPLGLATDGKQLYWSQENPASIGTAGIDGSNANPNFISIGDFSLGIAIDLPPSNISAPTIGGSTVVGQTLTETNGIWAWNPTAFNHQWLRCDGAGNGCAPIGGATGGTYTLTSADSGSTIRVQEVASNPFGGDSKPAVSAPTAVVTTPPVTSVSSGTSTPAPGPPTATLASASGSGATALLTVGCHGVSGQSCSINVTGTSHERKRAAQILAVTASKHKGGHKGKPKVKTVTVTVAQGSFSVPAGQSATVAVSLNATGRRLLAAFRRLPVTLVLTGSVTTTQRVVFTQVVSRLRVGTPPDNWFHINVPCGNCYTTPQSVPITGLPAGVHVTVLCSGGGCPFSRRAVTARKGRINVAAVLGGSHLQPGAVINVMISAKNRIGADVRYAIQRGSGPIRTILCVQPGASAPSRCT
jgi:hypothetical protein